MTNTTLASWHNSFGRMRFPRPLGPEREHSGCVVRYRCALLKTPVSYIKEETQKMNGKSSTGFWNVKCEAITRNPVPCTVTRPLSDELALRAIHPGLRHTASRCRPSPGTPQNPWSRIATDVEIVPEDWSDTRPAVQSILWIEKIKISLYKIYSLI